MRASRIAGLASLTLSAACTHYELDPVLEPPASGALIAERGGATLHYSPSEGATGYRVYATRVATATPEQAEGLAGAVILEEVRPPTTFENLAVDGQPWYVFVTAVRGSEESASSPTLVVHPLAADAPFFETAPVFTEPGGAGDLYGGVLEAGDFNRDGIADLSTGTPSDDSNGPDGGLVEFWFGRPAGFPGTAPIGIPQNEGRFGSSVAVADFDCDGFDDAAVGHPFQGTDDRGLVDVFRGDPYDPANYDDDFFPPFSTATNLGFGAALAAGDIDGDGCADLVVAEAGRPGLLPSVRLYRGSATGLDTVTPPATRVSPTGLEETGWGATLLIDDLDGDGFDDIVVGEPGYDDGAITDAGAVTIFLGPEGFAPPATPGRVLPGSAAGMRLGASLSSGDFDRDGFTDLVLGTQPVTGPPQVAIVRGGATLAELLTVLVLDGAASSAAVPLAARAFDLDGDGYDDLVLGDPQAAGMTSTSGAIIIRSGSEDGLVASADMTLAAPAGNAFFGQALVLGDFDGTGTIDLIAGAPRTANEGRFSVFRGLPTRGPHADAGQARFLAFNANVELIDAWFVDRDSGPHTCAWDVGGIQRTVDPCDNANIDDDDYYWNRGPGRFTIRLRVTAADGRYGEAFAILTTETE